MTDTILMQTTLKILRHMVEETLEAFNKTDCPAHLDLYNSLVISCLSALRTWDYTVNRLTLTGQISVEASNNDETKAFYPKLEQLIKTAKEKSKGFDSIYIDKIHAISLHDFATYELWKLSLMGEAEAYKALETMDMSQTTTTFYQAIHDLNDEQPDEYKFINKYAEK